MSGVEVVAVVACVAAVVSAYNDGSRMFTAIRKKWHERRRQPDQSSRDLEWSLARGHHEIVSQYKRHHQELGRLYEEGDSIAREQMKDIIITLQGALLRHLREAQEQGSSLDLMALQVESEQGRVRTLVILGDLYQRLARASSIPPTISMTVDPMYGRGHMYNGGYFPHTPDRFSPAPNREMMYLSGGYPVSPGPFLFEGLSASPPNTQGTSGVFDTSLSSRRRSSGFGSAIGSIFSRSPRSSRSSFTSSAPEPGFHNHPGFCHTVSPSTPEPVSETPARSPQRPNLRLSPVEDDNLWGSQWKEIINSDDDEMSHTYHPQLKVEASNHHLSPTTANIISIHQHQHQHRHSLPPPSIASTDSTPSNPSTTSASSQTTLPQPATRPPAQPPGQRWSPSKTNNYLGFCKGAWKVHTGFRGFKIHTEPGSGYYTQVSWLRCVKCAFEGPMATKCSSNNPQFDDSVRVHGPTGIRYRWEFLAKSHVPCKRDSAVVFSPVTPRGAFCCMFCCVEVRGSTGGYGNLDTFMAHLGKAHRSVGESALALLPTSTKCVFGRVAGDREYFDVNVP
ncbi:hypothetical protein PENANT_c002G08711 [Penicillium antarcticum]|uniref:Prion-inhibition and propagation HeLo domain-containing protein n=1 Tax=Penicillium antarcticum TaxID=416450 RepID=A0A1V6QJY9_9EURO|nr:hypothetical protein PENANT_c002G08711 [Penicillium antarcticum]